MTNQPTSELKPCPRCKRKPEYFKNLGKYWCRCPSTIDEWNSYCRAYAMGEAVEAIASLDFKQSMKLRAKIVNDNNMPILTTINDIYGWLAAGKITPAEIMAAMKEVQGK